MTYHSSGDYLVGIEYEALDDLHGHFTIRRKVPMTELIDELKGFMQNGHYYPQFPPEANPSVVYAYDLNEKEDADILGILDNLLNKSINKEKRNGTNIENSKENS